MRLHDSEIYDQARCNLFDVAVNVTGAMFIVTEVVEKREIEHKVYFYKLSDEWKELKIVSKEDENIKTRLFQK
jgi:hypothetical protein